MPILEYPSQFYNRFDATKRYKMLLFRAARGLQSAELNEIHATLHHEFRTLADNLYGDGAIVRGGSFTQQGDRTQFIATEATFYALGYLHEVPQFIFTVLETESCSIGIAVSMDVVSENEDPDLRDPAISRRGFNEPGAHRLRYTARWVKQEDVTSQESFYSIITFIEGSRVTVVREAPEMQSARDLIARLDYQSNGSYVVSGFTVTNVANLDASKQHLISVSVGTARVEGYERVFDYARRTTIDYALETGSVQNEPIPFSGDGLYPLRRLPIAATSEVNGIKQIVRTITHGNFLGCRDLLKDIPVFRILKVNQGGLYNIATNTFTGGVSYNITTDYVLDGDYINWSPTGAEPAPGSTYTVVYQYSVTIIPTISSDRKSIILSDLVPGSSVFIDYTHFLPRIDAIVLNRSGELVVVKGKPDYFAPQKPKVDFGLQLATAFISYGGTPVLSPDYLRAYKFEDIYRLEQAVTDLKYNVATLSLSDRLRATDPTTTKRGTFVDSFQNDAQRDSGLSQNAVSREGILSAPILWKPPLVVRSGTRVRIPRSEKLLLSQTSYTKSRVINAYSTALPPPATISLAPRAARWITQEIFQDLFQTTYVTNTAVTATAIAVATATALNSPVSIVRDTASSLSKAEIPPTDIEVTASRFNAKELVEIYFDGAFVKTVAANQDGVISTIITTPYGSMSGVKIVSLLGQDSGVAGSTTFEGTPVLDTVTTTSVQTVALSPFIPISAPLPISPTVNAQISNQVRPKITGRAVIRTGETFTVIVRGITYFIGANLTYDATTASWALQIPNTDPALPEGQHSVIARIVNSDGIVVQDPTTQEITVDITNPKVAVTSITQDTGVVGDFVTEDPTLIFAGITEPNLKLTISLQASTESSATKIGDATANQSGEWVFNYTTTTLRNNQYTLVVGVTDVAGNKSTTRQNFTVQVPPPPVPTSTRLDPLAQTFSTLSGLDAFITSIELQFAAKSSKPEDFVEVAIVPLVMGIPDRSRWLSSARAYPKDISTTAGTWTKFLFPEVVHLSGQTEYAFIVISPTNATTLRVAELGQYDIANLRTLSKSPYEAGVLLESVNQSTWSQIPREDIMFRINYAEFLPQHIQSLATTLAVENATDVMLLAGIEQPTDTRLSFNLTQVGSSGSFNLVPYRAQAMAQFTGSFALTANMATSDLTISPTIDGDIRFSFGTVQYPAKYITRAISVPSSTTTIKLFLDIFEPQDASVSVQYRDAADTDWVSFTRQSLSAVSVGDGVTEMPFTASVSSLSATRLRIVLDTSNNLHRPYAKNLRLFFA